MLLRSAADARGRQVTLIGRKCHVDAINERGLLLEIGQKIHPVPIRATTRANGIPDADVVLVCIKSGDTEDAGRQIAPYLKDDAILLSLQNGVDNADRLAAIVDRTAVPQSTSPPERRDPTASALWARRSCHWPLLKRE
jgi:2-dehydropantoate 2-reductase